MSYTVYMHTCPNGKKYIGITRQYPINKRWRNGSGYYRNDHFNRAIKKYGWDNIEHEIMAIGRTLEEAANLERHLIDVYQTRNYKFGYNKTDGGEGPTGFKHSNKTKLIMSQQRKGKTKTQEHIEKITKSLTGQKRTAEFRARMKIIKRGTKPPFNGSMLNDEQKNRIASHFEIPITQYTLEGQFVREWKSIKAAQKGLRNKKSPNIQGCLADKIHIAYGFYWNYKNVDITQEEIILFVLKHQQRVNAHYKKLSEINKGRTFIRTEEYILKHCKAVTSYDLLGNVVKNYQSITQATQDVGGKHATSIAKCCKGKQATAYGYRWEYAEDTP